MSARMPSLTLLSAAMALTLLAARPAQAATATVHVTMDVTQIAQVFPDFFGAQDSPAFSPPVSFSLALGDTLDYTIDFLGAQTLTVIGVQTLWGLVYSSNGGNQSTTARGTLMLLDTAGAVLASSVEKTDTAGDVHVGQSFFASEFPTLGSDVTFSGVRYVGTVLDYTPVDPLVDPVITTRDYVVPGFYFGATGFVSSVPEPGSAGLLAAGLAGVGLWLRRRRV